MQNFTKKLFLNYLKFVFKRLDKYEIKINITKLTSAPVYKNWAAIDTI